MVYSAKSDDIGTISQFTRRKDITITTGGTSTPANYQVKLTIAYESEMQTDFDDIRFNTKAGEYIDYWIESKTDSVTATVWIELPDAITDPGSDTIWMCYGNGDLSDGINGDDTFMMYHGAASSEFIDSLDFDPTTSFVFEARVRLATGGKVRYGLSNSQTSADDGFQIQPNADNGWGYVIAENENTQSYLGEAGLTSANTWHCLKMTFDGTTLYGYQDGNEINTGGVSTNLPNENLGIYMDFAVATGEQAWSFIRKYLANEPTLSYGISQHQRRVPQFIN